LNTYGERRVNSEAAYRQALKENEGGRRLASAPDSSRKLSTSEFLRSLKAKQNSGVLPFVASTILALGSAASMAL